MRKRHKCHFLFYPEDKKDFHIVAGLLAPTSFASNPSRLLAVVIIDLSVDTVAGTALFIQIPY